MGVDTSPASSTGQTCKGFGARGKARAGRSSREAATCWWPGNKEGTGKQVTLEVSS